MGLFDNSPSNTRCIVPNKNGPPVVPLFGTTTFKTFAEIFSGACAAFSTVVCLGLVLLHALRYSKPFEQKHIMRATSMISIFAILSFATTFLTNHNAQYVLVLQDLYEAYAFASFFLLVAAWLGQTQAQDIQVPLHMRQGASGSPPPKPIMMEMSQGQLASIIGSRWALVFQFPVVVTIFTIVTEATNGAGVYCVSSNSIHFAHLWVTIFKAISTAVAFIALLRIVHMSKESLAPFKPMRKLVSFKSIIALRFIQTFIFTFLLNNGHISPTKFLSYIDIAVGIPAMILCIEMVLFSLLFLYTFGVGPYLVSNIHPDFGVMGYQGGPLGLWALLQALNVVDLFRGMVTAIGVF